MFVCDHVVAYFDVKRTLGRSSFQIWNGWFQKISIPIPRAASRNSEGEGGYVDWNSEGMGGFSGE